MTGTTLAAQLAMRDPSRQRFEDRHEAGRALAAHLRDYANRSDLVVLALPRGGVPVAFEVARQLGAPLDLFLVRKLATPRYRELAMGAIASGGVRVLNDDVIRWYGITPEEVETIAAEEQRELERLESLYRDGREALPLGGRIVILVDDGLATGSTMRAAVKAIRQHQPARIVVAVPIGARETCDELTALADEVVCAIAPQPFVAVGQWYGTFDQTSDDAVREVLREHVHSAAAQP